MTRILIIFCLLLFPLSLSAEDKRSDYIYNSEAEVAAQKELREPPLLPGEEVERGGKRIRVITTTGPVPVSKSPEPWQEGLKGNIDSPEGGVGVLVDKRERRQ